MTVYVKFCGVTSVEDARAAAELGADAIGLNFYPASPRAVTERRAIEIAEAVRGEVDLFGVFVNARDELVERLAVAVGLDRLQFHGDESPADLAAYGDRAVKVLRLSRPPRRGDLEIFPRVWGFLFERRHETLYGGAGRTWPYERLARLRTERRWLLAGGLSAENVRSAVQASGAGGVDVCSGVEQRPGVKDHRAMATFIQEARGGEDG